MTPNFTVEKSDTNALTVRLTATGKGWSQWFLLRSDAHHDNPACRQDLELAHLKEAKERGAGIIDAGDLFCAMQGKYDPRSDKSKLRPEHQVTNYLDALVSTAADFYEPYADHFVVLSPGNHELAILKKCETNLTERLAAVLTDRTGRTVHTGGYSGWIRFMFKFDGTCSAKKVLWYTHGYGGGGPVTEDMIQSSRQRVYVQNADVMMSGHVHRSWVQEFVRIRLNEQGHVERKTGFYVKTPTYKDAYGNGERGFEVERGHGPRPVGAYWLRFSYRRKEIVTQVLKAN